MSLSNSCFVKLCSEIPGIDKISNGRLMSL